VIGLDAIDTARAAGERDREEILNALLHARL